MTGFTEQIPGFLVRRGWEKGRLTTASWSPASPDSVQLSFAEGERHDEVTVVTSTDRAKWYAGTEASSFEIGKMIYPVQFRDVHWTVMQVQIPGVERFTWYAQTWRVTDFISATHQTVPTSWAEDFAALADSATFDAWLAGLGSAA